MRIVAMTFVLGALLVIGCDRSSPTSSSTSGSQTDAEPKHPTPAQIDKELATTVTAPTAMEAREWLNPRHQKHILWKTWDKPEARKQVDALYTAGATKVVVVDPVDMNGTSVVAQFVVELPAAPAARAKVFEWIKAWESDIEDDEPTKDVGQKYYEINLDL